MALADAVIPPPAPAPAPAPSPDPDPDPSAAPAPAPAPVIPPPPPPPPPPPAPTYTEVISGPGPDQINLTSLEEHVLIATGVAARNAEKSLDFSDMSAGQSVTVNGLMLTATQPMTADEVAAAFANGSTLLGDFTGSLTDWSVKSGYTSGSRVAFESATVDDLSVSTDGRTEAVKVTFKSLVSNQSVTVDGVTLLANASMTDQEVAQAFETGNAAGKGGFTGTMANWNVVAGSRQGAMLTFESKQIFADVAAMALNAQGRTEEFDITFTPLLVGQSLTMGNQSLTAAQDMSAADVAAAFNGPISGWNVQSGYVTGAETLTFISTSPNDNVIDIAVARGGADEQCFVVFDKLDAGQSVTIGGRTVLAVHDMTVSQVINDLIYGSSANSQVTGTLTGWDFGVTGSNYITFDSQTPEAKVTDLSVVVAGRDESATVTFQGLLQGQGISVGGKALTALIDLTADQVAALYAGGDAIGKGTWTSDLSGWTVKPGYMNGSQLTFVSTDALTDVTDIAQNTSGRTEVAQVTFQPLLADQSVTVAGRKLTASGTMTAQEVAAAFNSVSSGQGTFTGGLTGWSIQAGYMNGDTLTFVSNDQNHSVTDLSHSVDGRTEESAVTFKDLTLAGQSVTVAGLTLTALDTMTADKVALAFSDHVTFSQDPLAKGVFTGGFSNWGVKNGSLQTDTLTFASTVLNSPVTDLSVMVGGHAEEATVTFGGLAANATLTIGNWVLTAADPMAANEVAQAFNEGVAAKGVFSYSLYGWTVKSGYVSGDTTLTFISTSIGNVTDLLPVTTDLIAAPDYSVQTVDGVPLPTQPGQSTTEGVSSPLDVSVVTVQGVDPPAALSILTVDGAAKPVDLGVVVVDGVAAPVSPVIAVRQGATTPTAPDTSVTQGFAAPADPVVTVTATVAIHADSASPAVSGPYDVVTGFSLADDRLDLPVTTALYGSFNDSQTSVANLEITQVLDGMVTFGGTAEPTATLDDRVQAVLTAMGDAMVAAAFVMDDGQGGFDTYVVVNDGSGDLLPTDTLVKLAGVVVTDLYAIMI